MQRLSMSMFVSKDDLIKEQNKQIDTLTKQNEELNERLAKSEATAEILKKAVEFYADDSQWDSVDGVNFGPLYIGEDLGDVAQQALKDIEDIGEI